MKRRVTLLLTTSLILCLTACSGKGENLPPIDVTEKEQTKTVEENNTTTEEKKELTEVDKEINSEVKENTDKNNTKDKEYFESIIDKLVVPDNHVKLTCGDNTGATSVCEIIDNNNMLMTMNPNKTDVADMTIFIVNDNMYISGDIEGTVKSFVLKGANKNDKKDTELDSTVNSMKPELFTLESIDEVIEQEDRYIIKGKVSNLDGTSDDSVNNSEVSGTVTVNGEEHDLAEYKREFMESAVVVKKDTDEVIGLEYTEKVGDKINTTTITVEYCDKLSMTEEDFADAEELSAEDMMWTLFGMIFSMAGVE